MMTSHADAIAQMQAAFKILNDAIDAGRENTDAEHEHVANVLAEYYAYGIAARERRERAEAEAAAMNPTPEGSI